jgi:nitroreductase
MESSIVAINQIIKSRKSIFPPSYIQKKISKEIILNILENANLAPTHRITEPWRFTIYQGEGKRHLAQFFKDRYKNSTDAENFSQAKYDTADAKVTQSDCIIAINMEVHSDKVPEWEEVAAVACAVQNMWLTATAYGIGAYWSSPAILAELAELQGLPADQKCLGLFFMGYHESLQGSTKRSPIQDKLSWVE